MNANDLLLWISANGRGSWSRYKSAVDELAFSEDAAEDDADYGGDDAKENHGIPIHHRLRLNLERLGHAEFFRSEFENGWRVVPPCLVMAYGTAKPTAFLCGARTARCYRCWSAVSGR